MGPVRADTFADSSFSKFCSVLAGNFLANLTWNRAAKSWSRHAVPFSRCHLDEDFLLPAVAPVAWAKIALWELGAKISMKPALWPHLVTLPGGAGRPTRQLQAGILRGLSVGSLLLTALRQAVCEGLSSFSERCRH